MVHLQYPGQDLELLPLLNPADVDLRRHDEGHIHLHCEAPLWVGIPSIQALHSAAGWKLIDVARHHHAVEVSIDVGLKSRFGIATEVSEEYLNGHVDL